MSVSDPLKAARTELARNVSELEAEAQAATLKLEQAKSQLVAFDTHVVGAAPSPSSKNTKVRKKGVAKKRAAKKAVPEKAAAPSSAGKVAKKRVSKRSKAAVTEGRRAVASGNRPPLKEAVATVMGNKEMGAGDILAALEAKDWMPNSDKPRDYISFTLSKHTDLFERVSRGRYKVRSDVSAPTLSPAKAKPPKKEAKPASVKKADAGQLAALGVQEGNVAANPFALCFWCSSSLMDETTRYQTKTAARRLIKNRMRLAVVEVMATDDDKWQLLVSYEKGSVEDAQKDYQELLNATCEPPHNPQIRADLAQVLTQVEGDVREHFEANQVKRRLIDAGIKSFLEAFQMETMLCQSH